MWEMKALPSCIDNRCTSRHQSILTIRPFSFLTSLPLLFIFQRSFTASSVRRAIVAARMPLALSPPSPPRTGSVSVVLHALRYVRQPFQFRHNGRSITILNRCSSHVPCTSLMRLRDWAFTKHDSPLTNPFMSNWKGQSLQTVKLNRHWFRWIPHLDECYWQAFIWWRTLEMRR